MSDLITSLSNDFNAQVEAELLIRANAIIRMKTAVRLCGISRQEIDRRIHLGTFPEAVKLSNEDKSVSKGFHIQDIIEWIENPADYKTSPLANNKNNPQPK